MTYEEAIKILDEIPDHIGVDRDGYELRALRLAKKTLEKQTPKKPEIDIWEKTICPNCGEWVGWDYKSKYCCDCGQALDWSNEE